MRRLDPGDAHRHRSTGQADGRRFAPRATKRCINDSWGGYPDAEFLSKLDPKLGELREPAAAQGLQSIDRAVGGLTSRLGQTHGIASQASRWPWARLTRTWAASARDRAGHAGQDYRHQHVRHDGGPGGEKLADVPGCAALSGQHFAGLSMDLEAGQSAVGDIFNWFVNYIQPPGKSSVARSPERRGGRSWRRANPACWRWIGITAIGPFWWTSG